jgi:hypothetical protein
MAILRNIILPTLLALTLSSCYTDFEPNSKEDPVLCINSLITADETMEVYVTHTWRYSDLEATKSDKTVADAKVSLYVNDQFVEDLYYDQWEVVDYSSGNTSELKAYKSTYVPRQGDRIRIQAESSKYGTAEAEVSIPIAVPLDDVEIMTYDSSGYETAVEAGGVENRVDFKALIYAKFTDPADQRNYYELNYDTEVPESSAYEYKGMKWHYVTLYAGSLDQDYEPIFSEHLDVLESIMGADAIGCTFFTDNQISGKEYTLSLKFDYMEYLSYNKYMDDEFYHSYLNVRLASVSPSYYNWELYKWQDSESFQSSLSDIGFADQIVPYSNVSTGAGVVRARSYSTYKIDFYDVVKSTLTNI